jgi:hypothetical protein
MAAGDLGPEEFRIWTIRQLKSEIAKSQIEPGEQQKIKLGFAATGGPDGSTNYEAEFLVFRDDRAHFVAGMQTICDDLLQPGGPLE